MKTFKEVEHILTNVPFCFVTIYTPLGKIRKAMSVRGEVLRPSFRVVEAKKFIRGIRYYQNCQFTLDSVFKRASIRL